MNYIKRIGLFFSSTVLWSCAAVSQPMPTDSLGEKFMRSQNGETAIIIDANGRASVINKLGKVVTPCQPCSPEMEQKFGPKCTKIPASKEDSPICTKLIGTTVQSVQSINILRHTGSNCQTVFINIDGTVVAFPTPPDCR